MLFAAQTPTPRIQKRMDFSERHARMDRQRTCPVARSERKRWMRGRSVTVRDFTPAAVSCALSCNGGKGLAPSLM